MFHLQGNIHTKRRAIRKRLSTPQNVSAALKLTNPDGPCEYASFLTSLVNARRWITQIPGPELREPRERRGTALAVTVGPGRLSLHG